MKYIQRVVVRLALLMLVSISGLCGSWIQDYDGKMVMRMPLRQAIIDGDFQQVQRIVQDPDFDVNRITNFGASYLQEAIKYHRNEIVDYLLQNGADYDFGYSPNGLMHPLFNAVLRNNVRAVELLINAGADVDPVYEELTPLMTAVKMYYTSDFTKGQSEYKDDLMQIMELLLHAGADDSQGYARELIARYYDSLTDVESPILSDSSQLDADSTYSDLVELRTLEKYRDDSPSSFAMSVEYDDMGDEDYYQR